MTEKNMIKEQLDEFIPVINQLVDVIVTAKKAFVHQRGQLLVQLNNQQDPLLRNIASFMLKMNESAAGKPDVERDAYLRLHSILTHLQIITETTCRIEEILQKQIKDGVLFSDKAISQVSDLFDRQTGILSILADVMHNGGRELYHKILDECKQLGQSCLQYATDHEARLVEGLCFPQAAPLFLGILDHAQTMVHHEQEIAHILGNTRCGLLSWNDI